MKRIKRELPEPSVEGSAYEINLHGGRVEAQRKSKTLELEIIGFIYSYTVARIEAAIKKNRGFDSVSIIINSPGGSAFAGVGIYNRLIDLGVPINVKVTGEASSAASFIAMSGDEISIFQTARMMIHMPWGLFIGNSRLLEKMAKDLRALEEAMCGMYADRTGQDIKQIRKWCVAETSFYGADAVKYGFADVLIKNKKKKPVAQESETSASAADYARAWINDMNLSQHAEGSRSREVQKWLNANA